MKVFLDCGSRLGESVDRFLAMEPQVQSYSIFMFEPNPVCYDLICKNPKYANFTKLQVAVSNRNGTEKLWGCVKWNTSVGSTLEISKAEWDKIDSTDFVSVQTIDFSQFITEHFAPGDYIILKLNIEGAEYDVLDGLLKSGIANRIDKFFVDFHTQWLAPSFAAREHLLRKQYEAIGKPLTGWNY